MAGYGRPRRPSGMRSSAAMAGRACRHPGQSGRRRQLGYDGPPGRADPAARTGGSAGRDGGRRGSGPGARGRGRGRAPGHAARRPERARGRGAAGRRLGGAGRWAMAASPPPGPCTPATMWISARWRCCARGTAPGVEVVVATRRLQAADQAIFRHLGVEPATRRILALKSSVHFRADFEPHRARDPRGPGARRERGRSGPAALPPAARLDAPQPRTIARYAGSRLAR